MGVYSGIAKDNLTINSGKAAFDVLGFTSAFLVLYKFYLLL